MLQQLLKIKKQIWLTIAILGVVGSLSQALHAYVGSAPVPKASQAQLYQISLPAQSRQESERLALFQEGLKKVIQKATGEPQSLSNPNIAQAIESATQYVQQFGYHDDVLTITFASNMVNELIFANGYSIWGQKRPTLIVWLAVAEDNERRIIGSEAYSERFDQLQAFSNERGLTAVFPLMDLEDIHNVSVTDVWGQFPSVLLDASKRYGANAILVGKYRHGIHGWEGSWQLLMDDYQKSQYVVGNDLYDVLKDGILFSIGELKKIFGVSQSPGTSNTFRVRVNDIYSVSDFGKAESYLNGLDQVKNVSVLEIDNQNVVFEVKPQGGIDKDILSQVISMDKHLVSTEYKNKKAKGDSYDLTYRWVP